MYLVVGGLFFWLLIVIMRLNVLGVFGGCCLNYLCRMIFLLNVVMILCIDVVVFLWWVIGIVCLMWVCFMYLG